jgi:membrane-associated phospholipid phosphatase
MKPPDTATVSAPASNRRPAPKVRLTRWALWDGLRETVRRFRLQWLTIPAGVKIRYAITLGIGLFACAILTTVLTLFAKWWAPRGLAAWDERALRAIDAQTLMSVQNAILLESFGNLAYLIPLVAACAIFAARHRRPLLAITFVAAYVLARPVVALGWLLWDRARPTLILDGRTAPPLHSYPSGHVALALSVYGILAYLWVRASRSWLERSVAVLLLFAVVIVTGVARLRLGTHWPSDVIAGLIIGVAWLAVILRALHRSREGA